MNDKKDTSKFIDELLDQPFSVEKVNTPPFFKEKVLNTLAQVEEPAQEDGLLFWFTPKYQIAALLLFALMNLAVLYMYINENRTSELETFAQSSGLSSSYTNSILN